MFRLISYFNFVVLNLIQDLYRFRVKPGMTNVGSSIFLRLFSSPKVFGSKKNKKRLAFAIIAIIVFAVFGFETFYASKAHATAGINKQINFQGKLANSNGTNVTDGLYDIVFKIYTVSSGGAAVWTETRTGANQVTVNQGIFRVSLGSVTALPGSVDFGTDNIYLGITVGADSEMTPRVQFASVPQAFNAEKVNGLTVTNTSDLPFSSTTILKIASGKTVVVNAGLTFSGTDTTTFTFPSTGGNIVTEDFTQSLTNKTIGSTGLTFSGATTDITTVTNEHINITPNGTGRVGINTSAPLASFDVRPNGAGGGTLAIASVSGSTSFAGFVVDNSGLGDIFTASKSGAVKFVIENSGNIKVTANQTIDTLTSGTLGIGTSNATTLSIGRSGQGITLPGFTAANGVLYGTSTTGVLAQATTGSNGLCLLSQTAGAPVWGSCSGTATVDKFDIVNGLLFNANLSTDFAIGGNSSTSAEFLVSMSGTKATASVSGKTSFAAFLVDNSGVGDLFTASTSGLTRFTITNNGTASSSAGFTINGAGNLQTTNGQTLTIGGGTTGFITLDSASGKVNILDNTSISGTLTDLTGLTLASGAITLGGVTGDTLCLKGGATASWGTCSAGVGDGSSNWTLSTVNGTLTPNNNTLDFLWGGTSSSSAVFKVTGKSVFSGTLVGASISAKTSFASLLVDNSGVGDLFTASTSGLTRFTITNNGTASSSAGFTINGTGNIQSTNAQTLTLGGNTTGSIQFKPGNLSNPSLFLRSNGDIGIGSRNTSPLATLDVRVNTANSGGTQAVASVSGVTSFAGLLVDNSGNGDIFTASSSGMTRFTVQQNGIVQIGSTTNGLTFDYLNGGPTFTGTGRPTKTITLSPEYAGAILTASGSATTNGSMTSDASPSANFRNYYEWSSSQTSLQDYMIVVRVTLPKDFSAWTTTNGAITIDYNTELTTNDTNKLDVHVYNPSDAAPSTPVVMRTGLVSSSQKTWTTLSILSSALTGGTAKWQTAGQTAVIHLMPYSKNNNHVQIGDIVLNYLSKF